MTEVTIDTYDREGIFSVIVEGAGQAPILLETEGFQSSYDDAQKRAQTAFGKSAVRYCIVRITPVAGNELLAKDMQRMQK